MNLIINKIFKIVITPIKWIRRKLRKRHLSQKEKQYKLFQDRLVRGSVFVRAREFNGVFEMDIRCHLLKRFFVYGEFEKDVVKIINQITTRNKDVIDVGANVGLFSVLFSSLIKNSQKVLAIEPAPNALLHLYNNVIINKCKNVIVFNGAVSDKVGSSTLCTIKGMEEYSTLKKINFPGLDNEERDYVRVKVNTIDQLVKKYSLNPGIIKIDTEGAELRILRGALNTIKNYKPIIVMELSDLLLPNFGYTTKDVLAFLEKIDYKYFDVHTKNTTLKYPIDTDIYAVPG